MSATSIDASANGSGVFAMTPPGSLVRVSDETWLVTSVEETSDGALFTVRGVQAVKQKLPATSNPFSYFEKVIISIDTLKQERFVHDLRSHTWDAVVIDELNDALCVPPTVNWKDSSSKTCLR
ncbi:hypothetical protein DAD186_17750 [Dermabacter vaginalis]|uniref:Uncharacterized protein n=1 Tax=Dermabacter vaginalis TaxID=1630135 RepID=A0A1B0ZJX7_9MICO|nr:hypothetical protein [Dermabacter vaginalis]ANP28325.1 hypothetical protein DAD186_17750 [Dermabacter vaginalis]